MTRTCVGRKILLRSPVFEGSSELRNFKLTTLSKVGVAERHDGEEGRNGSMRSSIGCLAYALFLLFYTPNTSSATADVTLSWTAPGNNGMVGKATQYDLRYSTVPITDANWAQATKVTNLPAPRSAGSQETFKVSGLLPSTTYYFSLKTADARPNWSILSNITIKTTCPGVCNGHNGNVDGSPDGKVDISDLALLTSYILGGGTSETICPELANVDGSADGLVDLSDLSALVAYIVARVPVSPCP